MNQDNEKLMSFILEQQAKLAVKIEQMAEQTVEQRKEFAAQQRQLKEDFAAHQQRFDEEMRQINAAHAKGEARISELEGAVVAGINLVNKLNQTMEELAEAQKGLAETQKRNEIEWVEWRKRSDAEKAAFNKRMDEYGARHDETGARLDAFILVLEKYISENRNGKRDRKPKDT